MTLERYLRKAIIEGKIDHAIRASISAKGNVVFYLHPQGKDGDTLDFRVEGNTVLRRDLSKAEST
jgi:hypothetical protein